MSGKRRVNYKRIAEYVKQHPEMKQADVGKHFGLSQCRISHILRVVDPHTTKNRNRGHELKQKAWESDEQFKWEQILHEMGLGTERGMRLGNKRIFYGHDYGMDATTEPS